MNDYRKPVGVLISTHAIDRFMERFPGVPYDSIRPMIFREVQNALEAGRRTSKLPKWVQAVGYKTGRHNSARYVYNEERTRCYAIVQNENDFAGRKEEFGIQWVVKTTLAGLSEDEQVEQERLRRIARQNTGAANGSKRSGRSFYGGRR